MYVNYISIKLQKTIFFFLKKAVEGEASPWIPREVVKAQIRMVTMLVIKEKMETRPSPILMLTCFYCSLQRLPVHNAV